MSQNRRYASRLRQARLQKYALYGLAAALLVALLVLGIRQLSARPAVDDAKQPADGGQNVTQSAPPLDDAGGGLEGDAGLDTESDPDGGDPEPTASAANAKQKKLPIIHRKKDETKKIAITIDDCFDADIVRSIIKLAEAHGADLTFFPKGATIRKNADLWREIYEAGYEIENHSYPHSNVTKLNDEQLRAAIVDSEKALNEVLGVNYHMRLFRCPTGAGIKDARLHKLLIELGYQAVASWGLSGTPKAEKTLANAKPGQLILFHATKSDYDKLKVVIPGLIKKGYELVNVNDLYGKGPNEVTELDTYHH